MHLTIRCSGAREADFSWLLRVFGARPLTVSVSPQAQSQLTWATHLEVQIMAGEIDFNKLAVGAAESEECQSLREELREERAVLNILIRQLQQAQTPEERQQLSEEVSRQRQLIRQLQNAAFKACQPPPPPPNLRIGGIERTQATQFFQSLLNPCPDRPGISGPCPSNDIALVANKALVLRVYPDLLPTSTQPITALTGVVETKPTGSTTPQIPLTPYNAPVAPLRLNQVARKNANDTLNFRIPPNRCRGSLDVRVTIFDAQHPGETGFTASPSSMRLQFVETAPLRIRLVRIRYKNAARAMDIPAPTTADFWETAQLTLKTYPIPRIDVVRDSVKLYDGDFTSFFASGGPGAQDTTGTIFEILTNLRTAEGLAGDVHYLAIIPGFPANRTGAAGWAVSRKQIAEVFNGHAMAQEIGHDSGFPGHAPGCGAGSPDPNYPIYDAYPSASIGEFGFDTVDSVVFDPAVTRDFMSYCPNPWVSPYTYLGLLRTFTSAARTLPQTLFEQQQVMTFSFALDRNEKVEHFKPGLDAVVPPPVPTGPVTPYTVELHDQDGNPLVSQRLRLYEPHQTLDDAVLDFFVEIPRRDDATSVVIRQDDRTLYKHAIAKSGPVVTLKSLKPAAKARAVHPGTIAVGWAATGARDSSARYTLRYSNDGGRTWFVLAADLTQKEYTVDLDELPGGDECVLQVTAASGLRTGIATSESFQVARKPRAIEILSPKNGDVVYASQSVSFFGFSQSLEGSGDSDGLNWSSSIDGYLGSGNQVIPSTLTPGRHRITLSGDDGMGGETSKSIYIRVVPETE